MAIYRINLADTFDYAIKRLAFSAHTQDYSKSRGTDDNVGYAELEKIRKGDLLLLCKGIKKIHASALAIDDCIISDIDAYSNESKYFENGFRLIRFELINSLSESIDGEQYFKDLIKGAPFSQGAMGFCFRVYPETDKIDAFASAVNRILR